MIILIPWVILACLCACAGIGKKIGYGGSLLLCLLTSPVIGLIITICLPSKDVIPVYKCKWCQFTTTIPGHYCPRCQKDISGLTLEENKICFAAGGDYKMNFRVFEFVLNGNAEDLPPNFLLLFSLHFLFCNTYSSLTHLKLSTVLSSIITLTK